MKKVIKHKKFVKDIPPRVFTQCPKCGANDLTHFEDETFCNRCSWNSISIHFDLVFEEMCSANLLNMKGA